MTDTIKITSLSQMGTNIPGSTLTPVVDMAGTPTTKKATIANIANAILSQAGNTYAYAGKANIANTAGSAGSVSNASQPNITSVGTLTSLTVSGNTNLGPVGNVIISGGSNGQVLTTNGSNVLSWTTVASGSNAAGSNTQVQFNDGGSFGASSGLSFDKTTNNLSVSGNIISNGVVYANTIRSLGDSNVGLIIGTPTGPLFSFTIGGAIEIPGGHLLESDGNGSFELKSGNGVVISSDIGNTDQHFSFRTDGVFNAPGNVELQGTRLSIGPGSANFVLESPTVVISTSSNVFVQAAITNENPNGSADWTAYGTDGDDTGGWVDVGFTGYNFNDPDYTVTGPGDGYVFSHSYTNVAGGGNLVLATGDHGTHNDIVFATNGFASENEFGRISDANNSLEINRANASITFPDGTIQTTAYTGGANIGNVTFDDTTVQGDDSTLNLSAGPDYTANLAYLQVRAGDVASHIHFDTGNNEAYDLIVGNDQKFVQVSSTGNIIMSSYDSANALTYTMTLDNSGNLALPSGGNLVFSNTQVQSSAYAGGNGHAMMIDTNRTDTYEANGSADKPFKTFMAAVEAVADLNPDGTVPYTFVLMGCNITETVDLSSYNFNFITISTTCRSTFTNPVTIGNSALKQLTVRNVEFGNTVDVIGDGTTDQLNNTSFYNVSFTGALTVTAANALAFYEAAFFSTVTLNNITYLYVNGGQFNDDWTIRADDTGSYPIPAGGITPGVAIALDFIANDINFVKGGTGTFVFQPHSSRMGRSSESYTLPAGWIITAYSSVFVGTWTNNGTWTMRNSSSVNAIAGTAPTYSGIIGGSSITASGNITGGNIIGNGSTLSNVAVKTSGSWTLASGVNTVSISVPLNGTYAIWINGNIPNGIATYTATAVVTNTNVPVLGSQYAWYYETGNALVFTSIPDQFVGTAGSISNASPYAGNTANVFTFGITNNSGSSQVVNYGYTKL
jgi:hypothetical protein